MTKLFDKGNKAGEYLRVILCFAMFRLLEGVATRNQFAQKMFLAKQFVSPNIDGFLPTLYVGLSTLPRAKCDAIFELFVPQD